MSNYLGTAVAAGGLLCAARRYLRDWGTTKQECRMPMRGDELIRAPAVQTTEAVWIDAPAGAVWPWLVQLGVGRGGLYSSALVESLLGLGSHSTDRIDPQWQRCRRGDVIRLAPRGWMGLRGGIEFDVVDVLEEESLVLRAAPPQHVWDVVCSFHIVAYWGDRCRLLVRTRTRLSQPGQVVLTELAGPARALVLRSILLGIKHRAEAVPSMAAGTAGLAGSTQ